jgi:hypothetical protein
MRWMKWTGTVAAIALIIACCLSWVTIPSKNIVVSGIDATGTNFGKPGYFHFVAVFFFLLFTFIPRIWAKRTNLLVTAINMAWALRNYFIITMCRGGDCPEKHSAMYWVILASLLMLVSSLFTDFRPARKNTML